MTYDRDICERLEDTRYDGAIYMRREAAKDIRALRYYAGHLEDELAKAEIEFEKLLDHSSKQALDIVTLWQEVGRLHGVLANIANADVPRPAHRLWRADGKSSKHDLCTHGLPMYEDCSSCVSEYARAALAENEKQ